jgi:hypothetical protein
MQRSRLWARHYLEKRRLHLAESATETLVVRRGMRAMETISAVVFAAQ